MPKKCKNIANLLKPQNMKKYNKITVNDKKNLENEYKRTIQKVMNDFSSAIKILLSGDPEVNNEGQIIYLSDIQKNMIKNNLLLIAYNETVSNNIKK